MTISRANGECYEAKLDSFSEARVKVCASKDGEERWHRKEHDRSP
jgi:hypothetical protein